MTTQIRTSVDATPPALALAPTPRVAADLVETPVTPAQLVAIYAKHADELAAVVEALAAEERAAGGRRRTLTALTMIARALGEQHGELDELAARMAKEATS